MDNHIDELMLMKLADGELTDAESLTVMTHLESCPACLQKAQIWANESRLLADGLADVPEAVGIASAVKCKIGGGRNWRRYSLIALSAAAGLAISVAIWRQGEEPPQVVMKYEAEQPAAVDEIMPAAEPAPMPAEQAAPEPAPVESKDIAKPAARPQVLVRERRADTAKSRVSEKAAEPMIAQAEQAVPAAPAAYAPPTPASAPAPAMVLARADVADSGSAFADTAVPAAPMRKEKAMRMRPSKPSSPALSQMRLQSELRSAPAAYAPPPGSIMARQSYVNEVMISAQSGELMERKKELIAGEDNVDFNTEQYNHIVENPFREVRENPVSTFSIDVDAASYSNTRRFLNEGRLPPPDAVRIEEFINYFRYDYPEPDGADPFSVTTEIAACPWNDSHQLLHVGLKGKSIPHENLPPGNLVFLLDVSGSMSDPDKLPLLKKAFRLLTQQLRPQDRVAIVVYAGSSGLVLPSTPGSDKKSILDSLDRLEAGGSTAGAAGIQLAYQVAKDNFLKGGNNRVILATDGDFNVGVSSDGELVRLIEEKRKDGIFLTVLGFGSGNLKDSKMEQLADKGNGNYAYVDNILEAQKVLVSELGATLHTIAKDVKLQIEFNPAKLKAYRLIGYENRMLAREDFNDDKKDAGELGAGHTVTALYELIPAASDEKIADVDPLKYQKVEPAKAAAGRELLTLKLRYKQPDSDTSKLLVHALNETATPDAPSQNLRFSSAVAAFGMLLRDSQYKGTATFDAVLKWARSAQGEDPEGYRQEFLHLIKSAAVLKQAGGR